MINKKIASELAVGIVLLVALSVGGIFWIQDKDLKKVNETTDQKIVNVPIETGEKILYIENHWATVSSSERSEQKMPTDEYLEIFAFDVKTKSKKMIYTDKNENFYIYNNYNEVKLISSEKILLSTKKRLYEGFEKPAYKLYDIKNGTISDLPDLPLPDNFNIISNNIRILPNGDFVYLGTDLKDLKENENAIFICDKNLQNLRKIYSTQIFGDEGINSMAVSGDGKKIAFSIGRNGIDPGKLEENIYVMNIDGSELKKVFNEDVYKKAKDIYYANVFQWLSDNNRFVAGDSAGNYAIVSLEGEIVPLNKDISSVMISPDNSRKAVLSYETIGSETPLNSHTVREGIYHLYIGDLNDENKEEIITISNIDRMNLDIAGWTK